MEGFGRYIHALNQFPNEAIFLKITLNCQVKEKISAGRKLVGYHDLIFASSLSDHFHFCLSKSLMDC